MKLILTEKPSVAKNIADALHIKTKKEGYFEGNGYIITWAYGHLFELYDAKDYDPKMKTWRMEYFPFIPSNFQYKIKTDPKNSAKKQLQIIKNLMNRPDVEMIISACDYDREGQLIGDTIIYRMNPNKPVYCMLQNEWTQEEVLKGLQNMIPNTDMRPLLDAGICRQWADWVIGINLTSVATLKYQKGSGSPLNIGRVLLPTLKIIYDRDKEIEQFVPEDYYKLEAIFQTKDGETYKGTYQENGEDKFKTKAQLESIRQALTGRPARVIEKKVERKKEYPPYLFNLTNLQGYITGKYKGWTSDKVLKVAQSLYEKKYITYPRTASVVLEESLAEKAKRVLEILKKGLPYENEIVFSKKKRVFDNSKVESHSAIIPTYVKPASLTKDEAIVYEAIKNRFIMQFMPLAEHEETKIATKVEHDEIAGIFISRGRVQLVEGWRKVENIATKDAILPHVELHGQVAVAGAELTSHTTKPPKHHTEKTLLKVMETCGKGKGQDEDSDEIMAGILSGFSIGTPATRAETIKKLKTAGYITSKNKYLICTELGRRLVETFPVKELFDLDFTGRLEKTLADIEKQKFRRDQFLQFIFEFTKKAVHTIQQEKDIILNEAQKKSHEPLGKCPLCGHDVIEGQRGFGCSNWKNGCKFVIWKNDKFLAAMKKKPTKTMVKKLLKDGKVLVKGLTSKKGNKFDALLRYEKQPDGDYFSWKMEFPDEIKQK
ncbi:DNA topoisomerase [Ureibacillus sp. FSL K6-8385]|uniref:DNA topoisomerase n=1 Tax=Ureibacillus terrenus TaxID=118246 RepID=A0A540V4R3_9BACL|nr:type IA DNA topoisomerase [Ureibacillus terrenus]TQE91735.1 type IA DNA topoisomerase [Ureibacillus terrenus]